MLPLSLEIRAALTCGLLALVLGLFAWGIHHERQIGANECRAEVATATSQAQAAAALESDRRAKAQAAVADESFHLAALARAAAARVPAVDLRLLNAASRPACVAANPASATASTPAGEQRWVPAWMLEKSLAESRDLASRADAAFIAGQACQRSYGALTH